MRPAIDRALRSVSAEVREKPEFQALDNYTCTKVFNIIHSPQTLQAHWSAGLQDMRSTLEHPGFFTRPSPLEGVVTHDIHRNTNPASGRTG